MSSTALGSLSLVFYGLWLSARMTSLPLAEMVAHQNVFAGNVTGYESRWGGHCGILGCERRLEGADDVQVFTKSA